MIDSSFTPDVIYVLKHLPDTLEGLKHLVDILATFAYHDEPLTTQDMSNMFAIIGMISGKVYNMMGNELSYISADRLKQLEDAFLYGKINKNNAHIGDQLHDI